jgi:hypothetical protein
MIDNRISPTADVSAPKMGQGVVARGRTVLIPTGDREVVGYKEDGTPRFRFLDRPASEGETVTLPEDEITHLRRSGFLVDPDAMVSGVTTGPTMNDVVGLVDRR